MRHYMCGTIPNKYAKIRNKNTKGSDKNETVM